MNIDSIEPILAAFLTLSASLVALVLGVLVALLLGCVLLAVVAPLILAGLRDVAAVVDPERS